MTVFVDVVFTRHGKCRKDGQGTPYHNVPTDAPKSNGVVLAHLLDMRRNCDGQSATHALYVFDGGRRLFELGKSHRVTGSELKYIEHHYPGLVESRPAESSDSAALAKVVEEKAAAVAASKAKDSVVADLEAQLARAMADKEIAEARAKAAEKATEAVTNSKHPSKPKR